MIEQVRDYQTFCPQGTPAKERENMGVGNIFSNAAKCHLCNEIVRSKNRHHYAVCSCKSLHVDGGSWIVRRSFKSSDCFTDMIELYLTDDEIQHGQQNEKV